jgi:hypothetical protein
MCRFSDAGSDEPSTRWGDRRLKSAKARNRGKLGTVGAAGTMGIQPQRRVGRGWIRAPAAIALPGRMAVGDGLNERSGRCRTRLAV